MILKMIAEMIFRGTLLPSLIILHGPAGERIGTCIYVVICERGELTIAEQIIQYLPHRQFLSSEDM